MAWPAPGKKPEPKFTGECSVHLVLMERGETCEQCDAAVGALRSLDRAVARLRGVGIESLVYNDALDAVDELIAKRIARIRAGG